MTNTLVLTFKEIAEMMEIAAESVIDCNVQLADDFTDLLDESTSGEFDDGISLVMNTYVTLEVNNMLEHMNAERHLMEMLLDGVKPATFEDVAIEYFFNWCNQGELSTPGKAMRLVKDPVTIISNDGSEVTKERLINLFEDELCELLT